MRPGTFSRVAACQHSDRAGLRVAVFDDYRFGAITAGGLVDITECIEGWNPSPDAVNACLGEWPWNRSAIERLIDSAEPEPLDQFTVRPPVPRPRNLMGAPVNYPAHQGEVRMQRRGEAPSEADARSRGFFIKSAASVVGPYDQIRLPPLEGREFAYEGEIAFIVGQHAKGVPPENAWGHILGLTGFIDVTMRPSDTQTEERSMRKSFESFGPMGPWILLTYAEPDPNEIQLELSVNGERKQNARLSDMIQTIPELLARASSVFTVGPGDVFATGTPSGVGPLSVGDVVTLHICPIGEMSINVVGRKW